MQAKITTSLFAGMALLTMLPTQAMAGGDYYAGGGGVKDYGGTPVPAPIPVPIYDPVWYFRGDLGLQFGDAPSATQEGMVFGEPYKTYEAAATYGPDAGALKSEFDSSVTYALGVGYRWSSNFRTDITGEMVRDQGWRMNDRARGALLLNGFATKGFVNTDYNDEMATRGGAVLLNGYFDLPTNWGGITPYIGGGIGFALLSVKRSNDTIEKVVDLATPFKQEQFESHTASDGNQTKLAAMATVGASYRLTDITELDFNYRYLYVDGVDATLLVNGHSSTIATEAMHDHQIRAGVRFNIQ